MAILNQAYAEPEDFAIFGFSPWFTANTDVHEVRSQLEAASAFAASYFAAQFEMPLIRWGMDLRDCVCCIAAWWIAVKRGYNPEAGADVNIKLRYDEWLKWLEKVSLGDVTPIVQDSSSTTSGVSIYSSSQRGFTVRGTGRDPGSFESD